MNGQDFHDFLDHPERMPGDPATHELAAVFKELSQEEIPDPGTDYWNQFNHRLQQRLQAPKPPLWKLWLKPSMLFIATLVVLAVVLPTNFKSPPPARDLASLSSDSLTLIGEMFATDLWDPMSQELGDSELNHLLETTDTLFDNTFPIYQPYEADSWDDDLKREG